MRLGETFGTGFREEDWRRVKGGFGELCVRRFLLEQGLEVERLQGRAEGLPDFKVKGHPVCVEVKSHKARLPGVWQRKGFQSLRRLGWRILIARPRIFRESSEAMACAGIDWFEFSQEGRLRRLDGFVLP